MVNIKKYFRLNPRISVFISCFFISILFWLMIVFSKEYTYKIKVKALYANVPSDKVVSYKLPDSLDLEVYGVGFSLYSLNFKNTPKEVVIDLGHLKKSKGNFESDEYLINLEQQLNYVSEQFAEFGIKVVKILPQQISFYFDAKEKKIVKVVPSISYSFAPQYSINGKLEFFPKKIVIRGPTSVINKIDSITTEHVALNNLSKDAIGFIEFKIPNFNSGLELPAKKIAFKIPVEKFTETELEIPISTVNVPAGFSIKTYPNTVKVVFSVGLSSFKSITPSMFTVNASIGNIDSLSKTSMLKLKLEKFPLQVKNCRMQTDKVEYIIQRK
jgi:hypothetical protein